MDASAYPQFLLNKLEKVQNSAARLVLRVSKTDHISLHLACLHWLPFDSLIQYKLSSLWSNCLNSTAPDDLTQLLRMYKPTCQLWLSSDTSILCIPTILFAHTRLVNGHFPMLHRPAGTLTLTKSDHPTLSHLLSHHLKHIFFSSPTDCVCMGEGRRGRERDGEREN